MRFLTVIAFAEAVTAATYTTTESTSYATSEVCSTVFKTNEPASVKTVHTTTTLAPDFVIYTSTSTPYKTITPSPVVANFTSTILATTVTTLPVSDKTITTTTEYNTVKTIKSVSTITKTHIVKTYTTVTSTSTIPAPSGFIPIDNSTGENKADVQANAARLRSKINLLTHGLSSPSYEFEVRCVTRIQPVYIIEVVEILSTRKTALAPFTIISTVLKTHTATHSTQSTSSTTTTLGMTSTATVYEISTTTRNVNSTTTLTSTATASSYAACGDSNHLQEWGSGFWFAWSYSLTNSTNTYLTQINTYTAYDCCVACMQSSACQFTEFTDYAGPGGLGLGLCSMFMTNNVVNGTCAAGQPLAGDVYLIEGEPYYNVFSNGPCGSMGYGGVDA